MPIGRRIWEFTAINISAWALDAYLPVRTWKPPHSSETTGPVLVSRLGGGLDRVTYPKLICAVAATPPP
ncbi:hypothetical protein [Streptomyces sp. NBC_00691]|uniref:hypothetical protein n=1 Tax=Streptomyces sp. NBC_00691 TaxID=2903671 RepID=UPI002E35FA41|nr:hypothetical protein [Streptomyces sp. NBC_00691]